MLLCFLVFCVVVFGGVRVARSLVLYICFVDRCLFFCIFSFGHCVVCPFVFFSFLCCGICWGPCCFVFLVFCIVVFGGVRVALLFSFLCCALWFVGLCSVSLDCTFDFL